MSGDHPSSDAKKIPLLAAVLAVALGAVVYSWRTTQAPVTTRTPTPSMNGVDYARTLDEVDQLADTVRSQLETSATVIDLSDWQERTAPPPPPPPPAKPIVREAASVGDFRLKGIARGARATAFINDSALEEGESIGGYTVLEIGAEQVVLQAPSGERITLRMQGLE